MIDQIIALGIVAFLILFFVFQWDRREHFLLQLIGSFFFIYLILLIPKVMIDNQDTCEIVMANETLTGNITTYEYQNFCITNTENTPTLFYKIILWFIRLFISYLVLYFNYTLWLKSKLLDFGILKGK